MDMAVAAFCFAFFEGELNMGRGDQRSGKGKKICGLL
jgi:hypothetical protein